MAMLRSVLVVAALVLFAHSAWAQQDGGGLAFLRVGINAKAGAMGDAQVAHSRDAFSTYWNPAGLPAAASNSAAASYYAWVLDTRIYSAASRFSAGERGALGLSISAMGSGDLEARSNPGEPDGSFGVQFISAGLSYGRSFGPLRAGVTAKYLTERIYTRSSSGYAFDLGVQADLLGGLVQVGAAYQNLGEMTKLEDESTTLPRALRAGVGVYPFDVLLADDDTSLLRTLITGEVVRSFEREITELHVGVSVEVLETIEVRGGYISNDALRSYSLGTGFGYEGFVFDYAFLPFESGFAGPGHILTLTYRW